MLSEGIDFPFVLGFIAFLLNYIRTLGSILAGVPAVILAFLEFGLGSAGLTTLVYLGVNVSLGQIIQGQGSHAYGSFLAGTLGYLISHSVNGSFITHGGFLIVKAGQILLTTAGVG